MRTTAHDIVMDPPAPEPKPAPTLPVAVAWNPAMLEYWHTLIGWTRRNQARISIVTVPVEIVLAIGERLEV